MALFWVSCVAAGLSLACVAYLVLVAGVSRAARWRAMAAQAADGVFTADGAHAPRPFSGAVWQSARPWLRVVGQALMPLLSWRLRSVLMRRVQSAGMEAAWDIAAVAGLLACAGAGGAVAGVLSGMLLVQTPSRLPAVVVCGMTGGVVVAVWLVWRSVSELAARRRRAMLREFPFLLDLMTLCVEAGLNLHGALRQAAHYGPAGPLREELLSALAAMRAGHSRQQALDDLAARCDVHALTVWVAAVHQADRLGMSLGPLLRAQAAQQRRDRFLRAETLAMQAPVRLLLPLVTCMFPCSFLVIGFPIATLLLQALQ